MKIVGDVQITLDGVAKQFGSEIVGLKVKPGGIGSVTNMFEA